MRKLRSNLKVLLRNSYHKMPVSEQTKKKAKNLFFRTFKGVLKDTGTYKIWEQSVAQVPQTEVAAVHSHAQTNDPIEIQYIQGLFRAADSKSPHYVKYKEASLPPQDFDVRLIAFYLPQFHPFSENDEWWGKGFTEWTNVTKAVPQFVGHYQPHLPDELGFYDLRLVDIMKRQAELAKQYGVHGFCFYHYWFTGHRLMERPVDQLLEHPEIDLPFCLCWANENWSRRWDGQENDILIEQKYSSEDDLAFIKDLSRYIKDSRYIKVNDKAVVLVYRPALFPNFKETAQIWREYCREAGIGEIHLLGVSWGIKHPDEFGLDGLVEFPPHSIHEYGSELINHEFNIVNPNFNGLIFDYEKYVNEEKYIFETDYRMYKGVSPSWDNTARKPNNGTIYHKSSPELYKKWLKNAINHTKSTFDDDKVVFINAWNEWAEGAHLEPDRKYGYAFLEATRESIVETNQEFERNIVFVSHDAHFNGAQLLSLHIIKALKQNFNYNIEMICQEGGILLTEFKKYANVHVLHPTDNKQETEKLIKRLSLKNYKVAISNTVISGGFVEVFHYNGIKTISMIHELPGVIKRYKAEKRAEQIATFSEKVIFPSDYVSQKFSEEVYRLDQEKTIILPQGLYKNNKYKNDNRTAREMLRRTLNLPDQASVVLGVGYADLRKGIDLFCEVATSVNDSNSDIIFVWVGNCNPDVMSSIPDRLKENVVFVPATPEVDLYYAGADLYLLTSREDPFPSVVMEAMNVGVPVIGFKDAGGFSDIVNENTGKLVDFLDTSGMTSEVIDLINNREQLAKKGQFGRELVEKQHYFMDYVYELLHLLGHEFKKVSVVLPNYNYERYLPERLDTIEKQTYPLYELLLLDDCSKDKSAQLIEEFSSNREIRVVKLLNSQNSGSVFKQWSKGIGEASGDYIWMAEADDLASPEFLEKVTVGFHKDSSVVMGYTQSKQMDSYGHILVDHYLDYTHDLDPLKWKSSYLNDGKKEISESLVIKNAIPNVSGTVFKKFDIQEILGELLEYKIAGDWLFYTWLLEKGNIYFNEQSLNYHRRHLNSVTISENNRLHYNEVVKMQDYIMARYEVTPTIQNKVNEYRVFLQEYLKLN
ncbi:unknown protein [Paenibacillus amylolyticus]|uniref:Glycosyltransferase n=1 Tax=Paenibacillus amylolyticus TaxID=1451 RepID=A0A100VRY8_PAEAM|nr:unknown protein [Paenibacillus amylolyticus]